MKYVENNDINHRQKTMHLAILVLILSVKINGCLSKNLQCVFLQDLLRRLNIRCLFIINDNLSIQFETKMCPNIIVGRLTIQSKLCPTARKRCPRGPRILLLEPSSVTNQKLRKILFTHCDLDNIFLMSFNQTYSVSDYEKLFNGVYISMNCRFLVVTPHSHDGFVWSEIFRYASSNPIEIKSYGVWESTAGFNIKRLPNIYKQRHNLQGIPLRMGISNLPPNSWSENNGTKFGGIVFDVWMSIARYLNVSYKNVFVDTSMGNIKVNGTWLGLIASILKKDIDLGMSIGMSTSRGKAVDFIREIFEDQYMIFIRFDQIPKIQHSLWAPFIRPFGFYLWVALFISIFSLTTWEFYLYYRIFSKNLKSKIFSYIESFCFILGVYCLQGSSFRKNLNNQISGRFTIMLVWCHTILIYICYSGCIISILLLFDDRLAFYDLEGMMNFGGYTLQVSKASSIYGKIQTNKNPLMQYLFNSYLKRIVDIRPGNEEGLQMVINTKKFGFITLVSLGKYYFKNSDIEIYHFPLSKEPTFITAIIGKNSPYTRFLNHKMNQIRDAGIKQHIDNYYLGSLLKRASEEEFATIEIDIVTLPLTIMAVGVGIALILFIYEIYSFRRNEQNNDRSKSKYNKKILTTGILYNRYRQNQFKFSDNRKTIFKRY